MGSITVVRPRAPSQDEDDRAQGLAALSDIDTVDLQTRAGGLVDATFSYQGRPRYGYRAYRSTDGNTLSILSVDPITRAALTTLVVYGRVRPSRRAASPNER